MHEDLVDFYVEEQRHEDLFSILVKMCLFEEALNVWLEMQSLGSAKGIPEDKILSVVDYVWAGRMMSTSLKAGTFVEPRHVQLPSVARNIQQWEDAYQVHTQGLSSLGYANMESSQVKAFLGIKVELPVSAMFITI